MPTQMLPLASLRPHPRNPRRTMDPAYIQELARSMAESGQFDPIMVRRLPEGQFGLISGHCRTEAARVLEWPAIRADVRDLSHEQADFLLLETNIQRRTLSQVEEAEAIQHMINAHGWTQTKAAEKFGKTQAWVSFRLSLLDLAPEVKEQVITMVITPTAAREIAKAPVEIQPAIADKAVKANLPRDEIQRTVGLLKDPKVPEDVKTALLKDDKMTPAHAEAIARVESPGARKALLSDVSKGNLTADATQRAAAFYVKDEQEPISVSRERARRHLEVGSTLLKAREALDAIAGDDIGGLDQQALVTTEATLRNMGTRLQKLLDWVIAAQGRQHDRPKGAGRVHHFPGAH